MKLYYGFLFFCLFAQTPEAELLTTSAKAEVAYGHGVVTVTQGRMYIHVRVKSETPYTLDLLHSSNGERVGSRVGVRNDVFYFSKQSLSTDWYMVRVKFSDEFVELPVFIE